MKILKRVIIFFQIIIIICISAVSVLNYTMPDFYTNGFESNQFLSIKQSEIQTSNSNIKQGSLKLFDVIDIKDVAYYTKSNTVVLCGTPLGIDIYTKGLTVADTNSIDSSVESPAKKAGIKAGDRIISINGKQIETINDLRCCLTNEKLKVTVERKDKMLNFEITPYYSRINGKYEIGLWVRDSSIGMGMVSFYCSDINISACLGHPVLDADTGNMLKFDSGVIYSSNIYSVNKACSGSVGQLNGKINIYEKMGNIVSNTENGLYCKMDAIPSGNQYYIADVDEIEEGQAYIITTVNKQPEQYSIEILSVKHNSADKNLKIKITDEQLLELTGGIVQGMSGSPIVQNGKIVGVINYALVDNPSIGYAVFAKTMYDTAHKLANK